MFDSSDMLECSKAVVRQLTCAQACSEEQQQYKAYSALLHHAAESQLSALPRLSIASTAVNQGTALPTVLSSAALILAIRVRILKLLNRTIRVRCLWSC